jgi:hypothetical protein
MNGTASTEIEDPQLPPRTIRFPDETPERPASAKISDEATKTA